MLVKDVMSTNVLSLSPDDTINKFISLMEKHRIHEVPIVSDKKLLGMVHYKSVADKGIIDPTSAKLDSVMVKPPLLSPDDSLEKAAELIFKTALRAVPVVENDKLLGIISVHDVVEALSKNKEFRQTTAEAIMSIAEVIKEQEDIGKARVLLREKNISRLPVVDDEGKLKGIVTTFDLLKAIKPRERMNWYSMAAEKLTTMNIPVSTVMNKSPVVIDKNTSLTEIASLMRQNRISGVVVATESGPIGVVTIRDLLEFYFAKPQKGVYTQITGLGDEDDFVFATVDRMIKDTVQKLSTVFKPQFLFLHVKKYKKEGHHIKYSIRCRFMTDAGVFISRGFAWDLRDAVREALNSLEKAVLKCKERDRDISRHKRMGMKRA